MNTTKSVGFIMYDGFILRIKAVHNDNNEYTKKTGNNAQ